MLESHWFREVFKGRLGWGPFVGVQPGTDEIIEAIGVGIMLGLRREGTENSSWNIGIGYIVDPNVNVLGDGFVANQPPPGAETAIRLKETSQEGILVLFSFSF